MRKKLQVADLGDLLDLPLVAMVATSLSNGEISLTPYWHEWRDGGFNLFTLANGIKHRQMQSNPLISITIAENGGVSRGIEVRGIARFSYDGVNDICQRIARRYIKPERVTLFSRGDEVFDFSQELEKFRMVHVRVEPGKLRIWDSVDGVPGWRTETEAANQHTV
jgi:hypothetical protein